MDAPGPIEPSQQPQNVSARVKQAGWRLQGADRVMIFTVFLALFMAALEQTIVGPALSAIGRSLGDAHLLPWVATAYLLAATPMGPIFGALADNMGRRLSLMLALILFVAGSIGAALAPSMPLLIAARVMQGAGAAGMVSLPFVVIADKIPMSRRAAYGAVTSTLYAVASLGGPPIGGVLTQYGHWSLIFWLNLPLGMIVMAVLLLQGGEKRNAARRSSDIPGALLLLVASTATILALEFAAAVNGSRIDAAMATVIAVAGWSLFAWRMRRATHPLVPLHILTEPTILLCTLGLLCTHGTNLGLALYLPLFYQQALGMSAAQSGAALLGFVGGVAVGAYLPAAVIARTSRYKAMCVVAAMIALSGALVLMATLASTRSVPLIELATALTGIGVGGLYPTFMIAAQNAAGRQQTGAATGLLGFTRSMGGAIGVTATGMVAIAAGLTGGAGDVPLWLLAGVPSTLLFICFVAMAFLPSRRLEDRE